MEHADQSLELRSINSIRTLAIDAVQKANSGHPGLPLGAAPMAYALWQRHLRHNPRSPHWPDRDRFVLSAGHGSMLLYCLLYLTGYDLTMEDLKAFRQWGSRTPGHPEWLLTPGVEATTGPLGQGTANAIGMAIAERALAARFSRPGHESANHRTFALVSGAHKRERRSLCSSGRRRAGKAGGPAAGGGRRNRIGRGVSPTTRGSSRSSRRSGGGARPERRRRAGTRICRSSRPGRRRPPARPPEKSR